MAERWGALPLGELHPEDRCALCGISGRIHPVWDPVVGDVILKRTVLAATRANAVICMDVICCERRRYKAKRLA